MKYLLIKSSSISAMFMFLAFNIFSSLYADVPAVSTPAAALWADIFPIIELNNQTAHSSNYAMNADDLAWLALRPAFISVGTSLNVGPFRALTILELQQDVGSLMKGSSLTNMPLNSSMSALSTGSNYPQVGFLEGTGNGWYLSLGRRALHFGEGSFSLSISGDNPWYDHVLAGMNAPLARGSLVYDFCVINVPKVPRNDIAEKFLFSHRFGWDSDTLTFSVTEYNLVTGVEVDFQDIGPFQVYHHLFADGSNVMLQFESVWKPVDSVRIFAGLIIDDFRLSTESDESNPNAMGFSSGIQWHISGEEKIENTPFLRKDYELRTGSKLFENGLILSFEGYFASTYLYRRNKELPDQTVSARYFLQASEGSWQIVNSWFAYPLGPDRAIFRLNVVQNKKNLKANLGIDLSFMGEQSDETVYDTTDNTQWLGPSSPVSVITAVNMDAQYVLNQSSAVFTSSSISFSTVKKTNLSVTLGYARRFGIH